MRLVHEFHNGWTGFTAEERKSIGELVGTKDPVLCAQRLV
jgi:hypothetical protein